MITNTNEIETKDLNYIHEKAKREFEILSGKTILFTGANGFLGYYFIKSILSWNELYPKKKIIVYALDTFPKGVPEWLSNHNDLKIIKEDIAKFDPSIKQDFDYIIHAASIASPIFYRQYPIETINANVQGLYNILGYMVKRNKEEKPVKGMLFFSSSEIYGDPTNGNIPTPETYRGNVSCTGPRACYDESKRFGETLCVNFSRVHNLPIKIARPFNNYGPGLASTDRRVVPDFANDILHDRDITVLSQGSPTRTFCYVADAIVGYIKILVKGKAAESYNIGVEKPEISMIDLAEKMKKIAAKQFGYSGKVIKKISDDKNYLTDCPNRRCPQISKARKDLGYKPEVSLDEGLTNALLWYQKNFFLKVSIVGTGYVGLVTGISLAELGNKVICVDNDQEKVSMIQNGKPPFFEEGIENLLKKVLKTGNFSVTSDLEKAVLESDVTIIAVGTPTVDNKIDLSFIKRSSEQIGKTLGKIDRYHVVAVKSTVLPGVTEKVVKPLLEKYSHKKVGDFGLCTNPEFLREGSALEDALHPDRIVIGQIDDKSGREFAKIYKKFSCPKIFTNLWTAELTKYAANSLLATLISYSNEIARISEGIGKVDVLDVWKGVHLDRRLSPYDGNTRIKPGILSYIMSGSGFGGSCFPKDTKALASFAKELNIKAPLINSVIDINRTQPYRVILLLKNVLGKTLKGKRVAVLGLSFKPDTDDTRESPSLVVINELISEGAKVICHDPMVYKKGIPKHLINLSVVFADSVQEAIKNTDAVVVITSWNEYIKLSPQFFKKYMKHPVVIDGRRIYNKNSFIKAGIVYKGIGL